MSERRKKEKGEQEGKGEGGREGENASRPFLQCKLSLPNKADIPQTLDHSILRVLPASPSRRQGSAPLLSCPLLLTLSLVEVHILHLWKHSVRKLLSMGNTIILYKTERLLPKHTLTITTNHTLYM